MNINFRIKRVLMLTGIVVFLSFVYFMVRNEYTARTDYIGNPVVPIIRDSVSVTYEKYWDTGSYLVIEDPEDSVSVRQRDAVELALESLGQRPVYCTDPTYDQIQKPYEGIIITATHLNRVDVIYSLLDYAENGGFLIFAVRPEVDEVFKSIYQQLGIYEHFYFKDSQGIHFAPGFYSDEGLDIEGEWLFNSVIELHVKEECSVLATNDEGLPLIWSVKYGRGDILFMNNSLMTYKSTGGLLLSLIANIKGPLIYPVINAKVFALESFPLPSNVNQDFIKKHYLRTGRTFLRDVWWPDMVRLGVACDIKYTAGFLAGYEKEELQGSESVLFEEMDFAYYSKELARYGGEMAFTGAGQKPLFFGELGESMDFEPWTSLEGAEQVTEDALDFFHSFFTEYQLYAYLPPERLLDEEGYELIKRRMPELVAVCGDFSDRNRWHQDFEVNGDDIVSLPVVTTGFDIDDLDHWDVMNVSMAKGILFHSGDVSDLLLESDESRVWNLISEDFRKFCNTYYGSSKFDSMTVTEAAERVKVMQSLEPEITYAGDRINVKINNGSRNSSFILLCFGREPQNIPGVTCTKIHNGKYLVTTDRNEFTLELKNI